LWHCCSFISPWLLVHSLLLLLVVVCALSGCHRHRCVLH
jgi:hypothetical protein